MVRVFFSLSDAFDQAMSISFASGVLDMSRSSVSCRRSRARSSTADMSAFVEAAPLVRHWYLDAGLLFDRPRLPQDHIEHRAIDGIVLAVYQDRSDDLALLAKSIDTTFALLMPRRVPGQIVVNDRIEVRLEVDAFGEAIGRHKNTFLELAEGLNLGLSILGRKRPSNDFDLVIFKSGSDGGPDRLGGR